MSHDPTPLDLELADRANLYGASDYSIIGDGTRTPAERHAVLRAAADEQQRAYDRARADVARVAERQQRCAREQARLLRPVVQAAIQEREAAAPAKLTPRFFQPFAGAVIIDTTTDQPWWGPFYCCGVYVAAGAEHAQRAIIARDHLEALRRNDWMDRQRLAFEVTHEGRLALVGLA